MAQMTGYVCDVCEKFALKKSHWLQLSGGPNTQGSIDLCSNKCLVKIARQRLEAEKEVLAADPNNRKPAPFSTQGMGISDDQKDEIVLEAIENGVKATAVAHGLPWQAVARWKADRTEVTR